MIVTPKVKNLRMPQVTHRAAPPAHGAVQDRVDQLQSLCAELYQVLATVGAPTCVLDKVWAAAAGQEIPHEDLLPIAEMEFSEVQERQSALDEIAKLLTPHYASAMGSLGGQSTSEAKRRAARENGRKGGRPRKHADARR